MIPDFSRRCLVRLPLAMLITLAGCSSDSNGGDNLLFEKKGRVLGGPQVLTADGVVIEISPALEVRNTVQYVTLAVAGAGQWRSGPAAGTLLDVDGKVQRVTVELEAVSGRRYLLDSPGFGRGLMFSHVDPKADSGSPDLPRSEQFVRLRISADPPLSIDEIRWSDVTNK